MDKTVEAGHPALEHLPHWPPRTIGILATVGQRPYAIPVSAPVRVADRRISIALRRSRGSLARLRQRPEVALAVLAEGNVAFTAGGCAHVVAEPMVAAPDYAAVAIDGTRSMTTDSASSKSTRASAGTGLTRTNSAPCASALMNSTTSPHDRHRRRANARRR